MGRVAALITIGRSAQMVSIFILGAILSRSLTTGEYATYQHVNTLAALIPMFVATPVSKTVSFFLPRTAEHAAFLRRIALLVIGLGLTAGALFALHPAVPRLFDPKDSALVEHRVVIGVLLAFAFPYCITEGVMIARGAGMAYARLMLVQAAWLLVCIGAAIALAPPGHLLPWCLSGLLAAYVVQSAAGVYWLLRKGDGSGPAGTSPTGVLAYAVPVVASVALATAGNQLDKFLVPILFPTGPDSAVKGYYLRGAMEPPILGAIAFSMLALAAPRMAADHVAGRKDELLALWRRGCRTVALVSVPATAASVAVAPDLFALVFGEPYAKSSEVYVWYAAVLVMRCFLPNVLLESTGATVRGAWSAASQLVFSVMFACLLIPAFGPVGAAAAMCLASFASNWGVGGFFARNALACRWRDLCDWGYLARTVACCAVAVLAARWVLGGTVPMVPVPTFRTAVHAAQILTGLAVFGIVFGALALPLRIVGRDDLEALRKLVKR